MSTVSIITVSFNAEETISDCISSVASQSVDTEHILIDGGSTDRTLEIAARHSEDLSLIVSEPDRGVYDAMNKGIQRASGDIVGLLNADDVYHTENALSAVVRSLANSDAATCYGDLVYVDRYDLNKVRRYWRSGSFQAERFYWGWMPPHPTFFVKRELYSRYGMFRLDMGSAADYELMLRFLLKNRASSCYVPEVLVKMRAGGVSNTSVANRIEANRMDRKAWTVNGLRPLPWTAYLKPLRKLNQWVSRPPAGIDSIQ